MRIVHRPIATGILAVAASLPALALAVESRDPLEVQVRSVERAFAQTMADRDHQAFAGFLSEETIFLAGATARRGKEAVAEHWKRYFEDEEAPFSWEPKTVVVLESGKLAMSTGPVYDTAGDLISYYTSIWRQEEPGVWRIIFDKGNKACE